MTNSVAEKPEGKGLYQERYRRSLITLSCKIWLLSFFTGSVQAQVAYDPGYIWGWNSMPQYNSYVLAPYDIILDVPDNKILPNQFRTPRFLTPARKNEINLKGFNDLKMSGSGQFSQSQLQELIKYLTRRHKIKREKIIIVNLREEPHGFINGNSVTFYYGPLSYQHNQPVGVILATDQQRINWVHALPYVLINKIVKGDDRMPKTKTPKLFAVKSAMTEQQWSEKLGVRYVRIPVADHFIPDNNDVDQFIAFVEMLDPESWLHFKCRGGKGRTTTFMVMYDMLKNPGLPKEAFIKRQTLIHATDLAKPASQERMQSWKWALNHNRMRFINRFYNYLHHPNGYGKHKWSDWVRMYHPGVMDEVYQTFPE